MRRRQGHGPRRAGALLDHAAVDDVAIIGVEPYGAASLSAALAAGGPVTLEEIDPFVDGAAVKRIGALGHHALASMGATVADQPEVRRQVARQGGTSHVPVLSVDDPLVVTAGTTHITHVDEGAICSTMLDLYQNEGIIAEPAGALSATALPSLGIEPGATVVAVVSGGNNDLSRYADIVERALIHEGRKHYFLVEFPQEPGALRHFLDTVLGPDDDIAYFEYVKRSNRETGPALVGIELGSPDDLLPLLARMETAPMTIERIDPASPLFRFVG